MLDRFGDELEALLSEEEPAVLITCLNRITDRCAKDSVAAGPGRSVPAARRLRRRATPLGAVAPGRRPARSGR
jgi:hypothetical protein